MDNYFVLCWHKPSGISPRGALVVAFMLLHGVYECEFCLHHVKLSRGCFQELLEPSEHFKELNMKFRFF
jgi:hypothetical protein